MSQKLLSIAMLPLLLTSNNLKLAQNDIDSLNKDYEVIQATTGEKESPRFYAEDPVVETHIQTVSAIKKALTEEGIDPDRVRVLLYYDPIAIRDDSPPRIWNSKPHPNTITSPWLDMTKTVTTSGETRITIRIDATSARVISDLFSEPQERENVSSFLSIPSITESCLFWMTERYTKARFEGGLIPDSLYCAPEELKKPLLSLFKSSKNGLGSFFFPVVEELDYYCQNSARKYYSQLYPSLTIRGLKILENESKPDSKWWRKIIEQVQPIQECE